MKLAENPARLLAAAQAISPDLWSPQNEALMAGKHLPGITLTDGHAEVLRASVREGRAEAMKAAKRALATVPWRNTPDVIAVPKLRPDELAAFSRAWMRAHQTGFRPVLIVADSPPLRTLEEWDESHGDVLWWYFEHGQVCEAPHVGRPDDLGFPIAIEITTPTGEPKVFTHLVGGWPGYHTHWTPLPPCPAAPAAMLERELVAAAGT